MKKFLLNWLRVWGFLAGVILAGFLLSRVINIAQSYPRVSFVVAVIVVTALAAAMINAVDEGSEDDTGWGL